jgi:hypothetical protein
MLKYFVQAYANPEDTRVKADATVKVDDDVERVRRYVGNSY